MKEKDIYKLLNKSDTKMPENYEKVDEKEIDSYKEAFMKNIEKPKKKRSKLFGGIAIAAALIFAFFYFTEPGQVIYAKMVDFYERMANPIAEYSIDSDAVEESITKIDKKVTNNGIKFRLEDAMLDEDYLVVNMLFEVVGEDLITKFPENSNVMAGGFYHLLVNGKKVSYGAGTIKGTIVDDKTHQQYFGFNLKDKISENDVLTIVVSKMDVFNYDDAIEIFNGKSHEDVQTVEVEGEWKIDFKIKDSVENLNTKVINIDRELIKVNDKPVIFRNMRINSFRATLKLDYEQEASLLGSNIFFKAKDENGKEFTFSNYSSSNNEKTFHYYGEDGNNLMDVEKLSFQAYFIQDREMEIYIPIGEEFEIKLK